MTTPTPEQGCTLEDLRRTVEVGFTRIDGKLDHLGEHIGKTDKEVAELRERLTAVEQKVWKASGAAALAGMAVPYIVQAMGG